MNTQQSLEWRYATKAFDTSKELPAADLDYILKCGNLAATSYGLQPIGIVVVTDPAKKATLMEAAYGQAQVGENAALLVVCARTDVNADMIEAYTNRIESVRNLPTGTVDEYKGMMTGHLTGLSEEVRLQWAQKQTYIVLGSMMIAAAEKMVDGCPMEGFDGAAFNEILGLADHNLHATSLLPIGYRSETDETQHYTKVRKEMTDLVVRV